jgi:hypothetical protein
MYRRCFLTLEDLGVWKIFAWTWRNSEQISFKVASDDPLSTIQACRQAHMRSTRDV